VSEQRKYHRIPVHFQVTCIEADGVSFEGQAKDISVGGMFVECEKALAFGTQVTLVLAGVATRPLHLPAIVRWSEARGFGVQFGSLGGYATHVIVDLVMKSSA
jgi:PilZ domain-containing protein